MHGGQDQVIVVAVRCARFVTGRFGRVERELRQEAFAAAEALRDARQLRQVGRADRGVVMQALEVRLVPARRGGQVFRPGARRQRLVRLQPGLPIGRRGA